MMELKMEVYSPALELLGPLEIQNSVIWESRAFSNGSFSVNSLITEESRALLVPENIIWIAGDTAGIIEYVQQQAAKDGPYITVKGRDLTGILDRRILWGLYDLKGTVSEIMRHLVDDCCIHPARGGAEERKIPGLVLEDAPETGGERIRMQRTGGTVLEALELLGEAYQVAFGIRFNPKIPRMEFWARGGVDRSTGQTAVEPVFYSTELDDVLASEYTYNSEDYKNVTLVAGEGEGRDRVTITVESEAEPEPGAPSPPEPVQYTIALSVDPEGGGFVTGGGTYQEGQTITLTAAPASGYEFAQWQEDGTGVSTSDTYTFTANGDRTITAVFAVIPSYTVTAAIDPSGAGTVTGAGTYRRGTSATVKAAPADGYTFSGWKNDGTTVSTSESYTFTVTGDVALTAAFAAVSRLPEGYMELQYVQSSNSTLASSAASIVFPSVANAAACYCKFSINSALVTGSTATSEFMLFGYQYRNASNLCQLYSLALYNSNIVMWQRYYKMNNSVQTPVTLAPQTLNTVYEFYSNSSTQTTTLNGITKSGYIYPTFYGKSTTHACNVLFGQSYTSGTDVSNTAVRGIRIYEFKMMDANDGVLLHLIPCKNSSGVIGMYDIVGKAFYANAKGAIFVATTSPSSVTASTTYPLIAGPAV